MIPPPAVTVAQAHASAISPELQTAVAKRIGVDGGIAIVLRSDGKGVRIDRIGTTHAPKVDENTRFEIGEVSEAITGTLLADEVRRNELRVDEPLSQVTTTSSTDVRLPARYAGALTLSALATHRSGLPRIPLREARQPYDAYDRAALVALVNGAAFAAQPGSRYAPSNVDYALLGMLLADRAGTSYAQLAANRIFTPVEMKGALADGLGDDTLVRSYGIDGTVAEPWRWRAFTPEGGVRASGLDLVKFANLLFSDDQGPLERDVREAATPIADAGPDTGIGLGWLTDRASGVVYASGSTHGSVAFVGVSKQHRESLVILANVGLGFAGGSFDDLGIRILAQ
jgi:CubicO group peptidase (beta-lactamase class C family)